ncbi:hypothetical protein SADUNF_Sadunf01G0129600 [Salix dunnii]|uniref:Aconitase A/isopropylmalate dehydratase small subunit swivel domain-containing protein n=1 Tax=Salix dunnii TaxID=1413687 RepID=A0A835NAX8_9ROSI|nr:hypothetical protein SADUNF_Sadunf01G0129600 [Salix dunnii]
MKSSPALCTGKSGYKREGLDIVILAGVEYWSGSSHDWDAEGPMPLQSFNLLCESVITKSFERIHRSNLFKETLGLTRHECYILFFLGNMNEIQPGKDVTVVTDTCKPFTCTLRLIYSYFHARGTGILEALCNMSSQTSSTTNIESVVVSSYTRHIMLNQAKITVENLELNKNNL